MKTVVKYVGLDVHKDTTVIAVADGGRDGEVRFYGEISSDLGALEKVLRGRRSPSGRRSRTPPRCKPLARSLVRVPPGIGYRFIVTCDLARPT